MAGTQHHPRDVNLRISRKNEASLTKPKYFSGINPFLISLKRMFSTVLTIFPFLNHYKNNLYPSILSSNKKLTPREENFYTLIPMLPYKEMEEADLSPETFEALEHFVLDGHVIDHSITKVPISRKFLPNDAAFGRRGKNKKTIF